ncbi:universal stress protein [Haloplanus rubicundus]|uniref:Universal stress protein n=1 Tax=Haloplanus rubicundus TaxID=1547898 RepID=A0A345E9U4_9EURY|nr:universal stress protein [Haloplanus rubicundus]AXG08966.1 universal stress protein [Haloplanus rubicundus]
MTRHLLVSFDDSELSDRALTFACSAFPEDRITVMYVIDARSDETAAAGWGNTTDQYERWVASRREFADELLHHAEAIADEHGVTLDTVVAIGRVRDAIVDYAADHDVDLVVMGFHPRSRLSAYLAGEFSDRVIRSSDLPVALVK